MEIKNTIGGFLIQDKDNLTINVDNIDIPTIKNQLRQNYKHYTLHGKLLSMLNQMQL